MGSKKDVLVEDRAPSVAEFRDHVLEGLRKSPKAISSKFLYDERGSEIFEKITDVVDYYPTRAERTILEARGNGIARLIGERCAVIEPGSGNSEKIPMLLNRLENPVAYIPIEISQEFLVRAAEEISAKYPGLEVLPVCADFTQPLELPVPKGDVARNLVFFPGGTIGNLHPSEASRFLERFRLMAGKTGAVLVGVDLVKDHDIIERAYNDSEGVTAAFNLNLIDRMNREIGADFDRSAFRHHAPFNAEESRIEMHLVSEADQTVHIGSEAFDFKAGEPIVTEYSYKYTPERFGEVAREAGLDVAKVWTDEKGLFSLQLCVARVDGESSWVDE